MKTIAARFDPRVLPAWARQYPAVVDLCRRDLAYRSNVCQARRPDYRNFLIRVAERASR